MGIFRGKIKDVRDWWSREGSNIKEDEEVTIIIGKKPPSGGGKGKEQSKQKEKQKKLSKQKSIIEQLLNKDSEEEEEQKEQGGYGFQAGGMVQSQTIPQEDKNSPPVEDLEIPYWFLQKLRSVLKDNSYNRQAGNKLYGDLDFKHLYKISTTSKVFARKEIINKKKYNIALLVDCSGSMLYGDGLKHIKTVQAVSSLVLLFQKLCEITVIGYNGNAILLKDFNTIMNKDSILKMKEIIGKETKEHGSHTDVVNPINMALREFGKIKGRKIIIALTDGGFGDFYDERQLGWDDLNKIKEVEKSDVAILGVGIEDSGVKNFFSNYEIVKEAKDVFSAIIKLLDKTVRRQPVRC